jgi:transposase
MCFTDFFSEFEYTFTSLIRFTPEGLGKNSFFGASIILRPNDLPGWSNPAIGNMLSELTHLDERIKQYDKYIEQAAKADTQAQQLMQLGGIGSITASAIVATVGKGHVFKCSLSISAWLRLAPGQYSSGDKQRLGRITKAGDHYLRTLLVMGARAMLIAAKKRSDPIKRWVVSLQERRAYWRAVVAIAA